MSLADRNSLVKPGQVERAEKKITLEALWKIAKALGVRLRELVADI